MLAPEFDFKFITRLEIEKSRVGLADEQVAVALHGGHIAEFAAALANAACTTDAKVDAFGLEKCFVKSGEIQTFTTILFGGDIASGTYKIRLADIT